MKIPKTIIIDLDGVLWEGSCHAGLSSIKVREEIINILSSLVRKGIIIGSLSANHSHIAEGTLTALGIMHLFADWRFSFDSKELGMQSLIKDLNVLPIDVIYIDDTPYERGLIKKFFPEILVMDIEPGFEYLKSLDNELPDAKSIVAKERTSLYRKEKQRRMHEQSFSCAPEEFLKELDTTLVITRDIEKDENLSRIEEMFSRNHQFNSASISYNLQQLKRLISMEQSAITMVEAKDKYGSYGICGCIIVSKNKSSDPVFISDLTFSCRVQRPHIIDSVLKYIIKYKKAEGHNKVSVDFFPSEHNFHLAQVFDRLGLIKTNDLKPNCIKYNGTIDNLNLIIPSYVTIIDSQESTKQPEGKTPFIFNNVEDFLLSHRISGTILDIGSGSCDSLGVQWYIDITNRFEKIKLIKIDNNPNCNPDLLIDATNLSQFHDNSIDLIICLETLEHMEYFWKAIEEFLRILKTDGFVLLSAPLNFEIHCGKDDFYRFTPKGLKNLLDNAGRDHSSRNGQFQVERAFIEGNPIYPIRTFIIAKKIKKENENETMSN
jgi:FkbH-like protein